jgi:hypothetical protein
VGCRRWNRVLIAALCTILHGSMAPGLNLPCHYYDWESHMPLCGTAFIVRRAEVNMFFCHLKLSLVWVHGEPV